MRRFISILFALAAFGFRPVMADRLKDLADIEGARSNPLVGYGLVVGLAGTGDDASSPATRKTLSAMVKKLGVSIDPSELRAKNVAAVIVTAELPPFARPGMPLDVVVSSAGTAKSLQGGTLLMTPLKGADLETYALAQGPISAGGFAVEGASGSSRQKDHATAARIPGGAVVERGTRATLPEKAVTLLLRKPDFTTASRVATAINSALGAGSATIKDAGSIEIPVSSKWTGKVVELIATVEAIEATPDAAAQVIIDARTGVIVVGEKVTLTAAAVAYGGLTVAINEAPEVSQPNPFGKGDTKTNPRTDIAVDEGMSGLRALPAATTVADVAAALNSLGVTPRELISVLQALAAAGALHAKIVLL